MKNIIVTHRTREGKAFTDLSKLPISHKNADVKAVIDILMRHALGMVKIA